MLFDKVIAAALERVRKAQQELNAATAEYISLTFPTESLGRNGEAKLASPAKQVEGKSL